MVFMTFESLDTICSVELAVTLWKMLGVKACIDHVFILVSVERRNSHKNASTEYFNRVL